MEKKILIVMSEDGSCTVTSDGITSMPELIGMLETVKAMKVNESLGIKPYVSPIIKPR